MKFKIVEDFVLDEVYFTKDNLDIHHYKHVISDEDGLLKMEYMTPEEYNKLADDLSSSAASKINDREADIIGYVTKNGRTIKHDRRNKITIVYVDDDIRGHEVISLYKQPTKKFFDRLNRAGSETEFGSHIK